MLYNFQEQYGSHHDGVDDLQVGSSERDDVSPFPRYRKNLRAIPIGSGALVSTFLSPMPQAKSLRR